jgi:hypothetical protein
MTNPSIAYSDFVARARPLLPRRMRHRKLTLIAAWEACAWNNTLTDSRINEALLEAALAVCKAKGL